MQLTKLYEESFDYLCRFRNSNHLDGNLNKFDKECYQELAEAMVLLVMKPDIDIKTLSKVAGVKIEKRHLSVFSDFILKDVLTEHGRKKCDILSPGILKRRNEHFGVSYDEDFKYGKRKREYIKWLGAENDE